jgi:hypothetical protein
MFTPILKLCQASCTFFPRVSRNKSLAPGSVQEQDGTINAKAPGMYR